MKTCPRTGKPIVELSHSGLSTFASCPKLFAFRKILVNFESDYGDGDAAAVGTAIHEGLQNYMVHRDLGMAIEALALKHPMELKGGSDASAYSLEAAVHTLERAIIESDLASYELAYFKLPDGTDVPAVEIAFLVEIELGPLMFHVRGFIDLVLRNMMTGRYMPVDIKTTTLNQMHTLAAKYQWDYQLTSYGIPLNALLGNTGDFDAAIFGVILSDREPKFPFHPYKRTQRDVEEYQYYLLDKCHQIVHYYEQKRFPRHPNSCIKFGRVCNYHTVCGANSMEEMQLLVNPSLKTGDRKERPFNPVFTVRMEA